MTVPNGTDYCGVDDAFLVFCEFYGSDWGFFLIPK